MNVLILGAKGMAGHIISQYLHETGNYNITTFTRTPYKIGKNIVGDITQFNYEKLIVECNFDIIINCIGLLNTDCDTNQHLAIYLNSFLPQKLKNILENTKTKLIHLSTDCVFSGKKGNYIEKDIPDGISIYDRTKIIGEINDDKNLTFRNSIIGPDIKENGIGLFNWFMRQEGIISGYVNVFWNGVTTLVLAEAIDEAIKQNITGLYHLVNDDGINKFELLNTFNNMFNKNLIIKENNNICINKKLINTRSDFNFNVKSYDNMIFEMKNWIIKHKENYKHYEI